VSEPVPDAVPDADEGEDGGVHERAPGAAPVAAALEATTRPLITFPDAVPAWLYVPGRCIVVVKLSPGAIGLLLKPIPSPPPDEQPGNLAHDHGLVHCSVVPEPFGLAVLEGMAAGLAVVAADAGGPAELITDGLDGLLTRPGDVQDLADALRLLAGDRALRAKLGSSAQLRSRLFSPERAVAGLLEVYRNILPA
jgi:glycosyltransferase involved in cell wall biosynthesis